MLACVRPRLLPFWPVSETLLRPFCRPEINNAVLLALFATLLIALLQLRVAALFVVASALLAALMALDFWRLFYYQYWWWLVTAVAVGQTFSVARVWLAFLYTFAGLTKLVKRDFYEWIGPQTMLPVVLMLERCRLVPAGGANAPQRRVALGRSLAFVAVLSETVLGLILVADVVSARGIVPQWLLTLASFGNLAMHTYIIVGIGVFNNVRTFWSWNGMCACVTQLVFSRAFNSAADNEAFGWVALAATLVLAVYPLSLLIGDGWCLDATMGHAYFVSGWFGTSTLLLPKSCLDRLPREMFGQSIPCICASEQSERFEEIVSVVCTAFAGRESELRAHLGLRGCGALADALREATFACDATMVDVQFRVDADDVHKEYFGTHLSSFWRALAHERFGTRAGVHVLQRQYRLWSAPIDRVKLLN
jgi:hypothetical protein